MYYAFLALLVFFFFFNDTATTEIYTLSLHDALPISGAAYRADRPAGAPRHAVRPPRHTARRDPGDLPRGHRAQRAARPDHRRRAHQSPARLDGACLATGAAPPVRLLRGPVQRARGAAPAECTGRASRAGAQPVLSRSRRRARDQDRKSVV